MKYLLIVILSASSLFSGDNYTDYALSETVNPVRKSGKSPSILVAALLSMAVPGAGQLYCGKNRGYFYLAAELALDFNFARNTSLRLDTIRRYKEFAHVHANANYKDDNKFYEYMKYFRSSDEYNEASRQEAWYYYNNPDYGWDKQTRDEYYDYWRAGEDDYWYWDSDAKMKEFSSIVDKSNKYGQRANIFLGLMALNRLASSIDALFTARMLRNRAKQGRSSLYPSPRIDPFKAKIELGWKF
ncbi:MAG: hypothetical protein JXA60_05845 [Candidatus Coatesbacteria bacterium]|nr:hypothetical protein [Candidatus Coatesbacteria bacterium]